MCFCDVHAHHTCTILQSTRPTHVRYLAIYTPTTRVRYRERTQQHRTAIGQYQRSNTAATPQQHSSNTAQPHSSHTAATQQPHSTATGHSDGAQRWGTQDRTPADTCLLAAPCQFQHNSNISPMPSLMLPFPRERSHTMGYYMEGWRCACLLAAPCRRAATSGRNQDRPAASGGCFSAAARAHGLPLQPAHIIITFIISII